MYASGALGPQCLRTQVNSIQLTQSIEPAQLTLTQPLGAPLDLAEIKPETHSRSAVEARNSQQRRPDVQSLHEKGSMRTSST